MKVGSYESTQQGWQYCNSCNKSTWHAPKLGLAIQNKRKCSKCNSINYLDLYTMETKEERREKAAAIGTIMLIVGIILISVASFISSLIW